MTGDVIETVMNVLPTVGLLAVVVVGVVLWLMGRRLARAACAVCGLVFGGMLGYVMGEAFSDQGAFVLPLVIGAALAGALLAGLLFRVWMAMSGAALLALVVPAAVLVWQGTPPDKPHEPELVTVTEADEAGEADDGDGPTAMTDLLRRSLTGEDEVDAGAADAEPNGTDRVEGVDPADVEQVIDAATAVARQWYELQLERIGGWWGELSPRTRGTIYTAAAVGAGLGLLLGLMLPFVAASLESSLVGAILLLMAGRELAAMHASGVAAWFPQSPRMVIVWLGLITLLGFAIQWTLFGRRADR